jgi:asparagine synthase (glutamine-hydrolysing)
MCGLLYIQQDQPRIGRAAALAALERQRWRGPDAMQLVTLCEGRVHLGHNRLAIVDPVPRSDQPMASGDGRYLIVFNGEIYNHLELKSRHALTTRTGSDTEVLLAGFARRGEEFLRELEGMYAFVIHDTLTQQWVAARDALGIKPLYLHRINGLTVFASEPATVAALVDAPVDADSVAEWRLIRRPVPGRSFFCGIDELPPGRLLSSDGTDTPLWQLVQHREQFDGPGFETLLSQVVREHERSDVRNVALLSGGIDSAVIMALTDTHKAYSVGLVGANEFAAAAETAASLGRELELVSLQPETLIGSWRALTRLRGEPLSVPNEGLIHAACAAMAGDEKVVLTGEGADELLFGYDRIYRWALAQTRFDPEAFLLRYGYSDTQRATPRLLELLHGLAEDKRPIDVVEDFFFTVHLPGLLRRMDFASMAASKEARVPFADRRLVDFCYRTPPAARLDGRHSKLPLRALLARRGLAGPLDRPKIGFIASPRPQASRADEYRAFQKLVLEELSWS